MLTDRFSCLKLALLCVTGITVDGHASGIPGKRAPTGLHCKLTKMFAGGSVAAQTPSSLRENLVVECQSM